ncbi:MAG: VWA domain-containing protein [Planctomycetota bacterium]|jgi:hypothetical protein
MPQLINMLSWWQWTILAAVPPAIIALYFLKLKRKPLEVPSTYLWRRSIEDLHVNTIWQRLRRNLLLFLQLLLIFLAMAAVLRPGWRGEKVSGNRYIYLIDNSASMQATDAAPSRLDEAKRQAKEQIKQMGSGDVAMIVSFADRARTVEGFTHSKDRLLRALEKIRPSQRPTSISEALRLASARANPDHSANPDDVQDTSIRIAEAQPATLFVFSDGKFPEATDFRPGNLDPVYVPVGTAEAANVGILAFSVRRHPSDPSVSQAYARVRNFGREAASVSLELLVDGRLNNADQLNVPAGKTTGVRFPLGMVDSGVLELRINNADHLASDNFAWAVVNPPRRAKVLLVTPGNVLLDCSLGTATVRGLADVTFRGPDFLKDKQYRQESALGVYDLVIYDRCRPEQMPAANTLFIGALPPARVAASEEDEEEPGVAAGESPPEPSDEWRAGPRVSLPIIYDTDSTHPLMQSLEMSGVELADVTPLEVPQGGTVLIDVHWIDSSERSHVEPAFAVAPREEFEDAVMGFVFLDQVTGDDGEVGTYVGTNWPIKGSFPVFVLNLLDYFGGRRAASAEATLRPNQSVLLESPVPGQTLEVVRKPNAVAPHGETFTPKESRPGEFHFAETSELGDYEVQADGKPLEHLAVNLFHGGESDVATSPSIQLGRGEPVEAPDSISEITRRELWKWLLLAGLAVLCFEWYVYNRRVWM